MLLPASASVSTSLDLLLEVYVPKNARFTKRSLLTPVEQHVNPGYTIAFALFKGFPWKKVPCGSCYAA